MNQIGYTLALHRRLTLTRPRWEKLNSFFAGDWQKAYQAKLKDWQAADMDPRAIQKFFATPEAFFAAAEAEMLQGSGAQVLSCEDAAYPALWHNIAQSPALLFYRGNVENLNTKCLTVVGSRRMTDYGQRCLNALVKPAAEAGATVVSGLAFGVDAAAHKLALQVGAPTVAVLGNGIDEIQPRTNARLGQEILQSGGTILSEYLPKTEARAEYFPQRNRLVAGLSAASVIIEAQLKSGSLITARLANDFGRSVWAVPGDVFRTNSEGCNQLIGQGEAAPLLAAEQLLDCLKLSSSPDLNTIELSALERDLVKVLQRQSVWEFDEFLSQTEQAASEVSATITLLELKGVVGKQGNQLFLH